MKGFDIDQASVILLWLPFFYLPYLEMSLIKKRVLVWSGDNTLDNYSYTSIAVSFAQPIQRIVYAEWNSCSIPGYCFHVNEFPNNGLTSTHTGSTTYWRFINSVSNSTDIPAKVEDALWVPTTLMNISVDVFNPDGSVPSLSGHWCLEIDLWCLV